MSTIDVVSETLTIKVNGKLTIRSWVRRVTSQEMQVEQQEQEAIALRLIRARARIRNGSKTVDQLNIIFSNRPTK